MSRKPLFFLALAALIPRPALPIASGSLTAGEVLELHAKALGGLERVESLRTVVSEGTIGIPATGITGTIRSWTASPCLSRTEITMGVLTVTRGHDGERSWMMGANGRVQLLLDEDSRRSEATTCMLESRDYLREGSGADAVLSGTDTVYSLPCRVITLEPAGGYPCRIYIDTDSFLVRKTGMDTNGGTVEQYYGDFREVAGFPVAFRTVTRHTVLGQEIVVEAASIEVNEPVDPVIFLPPGGAPDDVSFPAGDSSAVGFDYINRHIYLPVEVEGAPGARKFLLDSGAGMTVIDSSLAAGLGLSEGGAIPGAGAGGMTEFRMTRGPRLELGGIGVDSQTVAVFPVSELTGRFSGVETGGILGYDFLSRFYTRIDYEARIIGLFRPGTAPRPAGADTLSAPLLHRLFSVKAVVDGAHSGTFLVDTGANSSVLQRPFAERTGLLEGRAALPIELAGAGGREKASIVRFDSISIGGSTIERPVLTVPGGGRGIGVLEGIAGIIGSDILERFTVGLDYDAQIVILERNGSFDDPFWTDRSGAWLGIGPGGGVTVSMTIPGTPAHAAGLRGGDVLREVGERPATGREGLERARRLFSGPAGRALHIEYEHRGEKRSATIVLRDYI